MSTFDRPRIAAVKAMEALGYAFDGIEWKGPAVEAAAVRMCADADAMHALLILRADKLAGSNEGSGEEAELRMIAETLHAYEAKRWPDGVVPRGKG